jgi:hypothetical protein
MATNPYAAFADPTPDATAPTTAPASNPYAAFADPDTSGDTGSASPPPPTFGREAGIIGRGAIEGVGQLEDTPRNLGYAADAAAVHLLKRAGVIDPNYQLPNPDEALAQFRQQHPTLAAIAEHIPTLGFANPFAQHTATEGANAINDKLGLPTAATPGERVLAAAARAVPSAALAPEALPAILPAAAGGAASQGVAEAGGGPVWQTVAGLAAGGLAGGAQGAIRGGGTISPEAQRLMDQNIRLNAAQATGSKVAQQIDRTSQLLTSGAERFGQEQAGDLNSAVLQKVGADPSVRAATPDVMADIKDRITGVMDDAAARGTKFDKPLADNLTSYANNLNGTIPKSTQGPLLKNIADLRAAAAANGGYVPGTVLQRVRTNIGTMMKNPALADSADDLRELLDDAVQKTTAPAQQAALTQARQQYRALKQIEPAIDPSTGNISAKALMASLATKANRNQTLYGQGSQDLVQLAKDARAVLPDKLANSGTPERFAPLLTLLESFSSDHPLSAMARNVAGLATASGAARLLRNQKVVRKAAGTVVGGLSGAGGGARMGSVGAQFSRTPPQEAEE